MITSTTEYERVVDILNLFTSALEWVRTEDDSPTLTKEDREAFLTTEIGEMQLAMAEFEMRLADPTAVYRGRALEVIIDTEHLTNTIKVNHVYKDSQGLFLRAVRVYKDVSTASLNRCAAYMEYVKKLNEMDDTSKQVLEGDPKLLRGYLDYRATLN